VDAGNIIGDVYNMQLREVHLTIFLKSCHLSGRKVLIMIASMVDKHGSNLIFSTHNRNEIVTLIPHSFQPTAVLEVIFSLWNP